MVAHGRLLRCSLALSAEPPFAISTISASTCPYPLPSGLSLPSRPQASPPFSHFSTRHVFSFDACCEAPVRGTKPRGERDATWLTAERSSESRKTRFLHYCNRIKEGNKKGSATPPSARHSSEATVLLTWLLTPCRWTCAPALRKERGALPLGKCREISCRDISSESAKS